MAKEVYGGLRPKISDWRSDWETPDDLFKNLDAEFHFTLDVCANAENRKCSSYFSPDQDGLAQDWWPENCWMNPPYGREISKWVAKAFSQSLRGATVVCLLPAKTDTIWWHRWVIGTGAEVRFVKGRLRFKGAKHSASFPSAIVIFKPGWRQK